MLTTTLPPNLQAAYLAALVECGDADLAAVCADTTPDEVRRTMKGDADFAKAVAQARASFTQGLVGNVVRAGRTDWKASSWLLERMPETRERFAPPTTKSETKHLHLIANLSDAEILAQLAELGPALTLPTRPGEACLDVEAQEVETLPAPARERAPRPALSSGPGARRKSK